MKAVKLLFTIFLGSGLLLASCGTNEQKTTEKAQTDTVATAPADTAAMAQYNKDEAEMIDKHATVTYRSQDGKHTVKIAFIEKENGNKYLNFQKEGGKMMELSLVTAHEGVDAYANPDAGIQWESKEAGGAGTLTENGKKTEYVITNE